MYISPISDLDIIIQNSMPNTKIKKKKIHSIEGNIWVSLTEKVVFWTILGVIIKALSYNFWGFMTIKISVHMYTDNLMVIIKLSAYTCTEIFLQPA